MLPLAHDAIVAAVIGAVVALLGLIISKESKISEFRQEWIDGLRGDIAGLITHSHALHSELFMRPERSGSFWDTAKPDFVALTRAAATIRLRLNKREKESRDLLSAVSEVVALFKTKNPDFPRLETLTDKLVTTANVVLKQEWNRVKRGELIYKMTLMVTAVVFVAGCIILYRVLAGH